MPEMNGIKAATAIRSRDKNTLILFVTDHQEFVYDVIEALPFQFMREPVKAEELSRALSAAQYISASGRLFLYNIVHERRQLTCGDIQCSPPVLRVSPHI